MHRAAGAASCCDFTGPAKLAEMFTAPTAARGSTRPATDPQSATQRRPTRANASQRLQERRYDPAARARAPRDHAAQRSARSACAHVLQAQIDYLDNDGTAAAFDSELALLWWGYYPRSKWQVEPAALPVPGRAQPTRS